MTTSSRRRVILCSAALTWAFAAPSLAQQAWPSRVAIDTATSVDVTLAADSDRNHVTGILADALVSVDIGKGLQFITRPFVQRIGTSEEWNAQIWLANLRYEHTGPVVGLRIDAGLIPSPLGSANLLLRPHLNPTIAQPSSLFSPLPSLALRSPRGTLLGALYPLGVTATVSGARWDARAGVMDTSPLRTRRLFSDGLPPNPPRFANVVIGGGVTPFVGFRVGASLARGDWLKADESPEVVADRGATIVTVESELAFRYTKLLAEWTRDRLETDAADHVATGWFLQAQQTLAPRWFVAGRVERIASPAVTPLPGGFIEQRLTGVEETLGFRVSPELTLRASHRARKAFGAGAFSHTVAISAVWWKRWL
ncbi:MAG: hypothetical protein ABL993_06245 [Vicinamibacterales bacterium]